MTRLRILVATLALAAACGGSSSTAVDLTLGFDALDAPARARVSSLVFHSSGDENAAFVVTLGRDVDLVERIVYRPAPASHVIALLVDAFDPDGARLASAQSEPITLGTGPVALSLALTPSQPPDGGADFSDPVVTPDLATSPDLATTPPLFVNARLVRASYGAAAQAAPPDGVQAGMLLLATFVVTNPENANPIQITPPAGWSVVTSVSSTEPMGAVSGWFARIATATEPTSYTFDRTNGYPGWLLVAAYAGVDTTKPFDVSVPGSTAGVAQPVLPSITTTTDNTLLVGTAFCPDDGNKTFTAPAGMTQRTSATLLLADQPFPTAGATGMKTGTSAPASCRFLMLFGALRPK